MQIYRFVMLNTSSLEYYFRFRLYVLSNRIFVYASRLTDKQISVLLVRRFCRTNLSKKNVSFYTKIFLLVGMVILIFKDFSVLIREYCFTVIIQLEILSYMYSINKRI